MKKPFKKKKKTVAVPASKPLSIKGAFFLGNSTT
jgi:hypothetical protein